MATVIGMLTAGMIDKIQPKAEKWTLSEACKEEEEEKKRTENIAGNNFWKLSNL